MKKKLLSAVLSVAMIATVLAGCGGSGASTSQTGAAGESTAAAAAEEGSSAASAATSTDGVKITVLNTKSEIQTQWEELAAEYKDITGVDAVSYTHLDVYKRQPLSLRQEPLPRETAASSSPRLMRLRPLPS